MDKFIERAVMVLFIIVGLEAAFAMMVMSIMIVKDLLK